MANGLCILLAQYAPAIWGREHYKALNKLQVAQSDVARWVLCKGRRCQATFLHRLCGWLSIHQIGAYQSLVLLWNTTRCDHSIYWSKRILSEANSRPSRRRVEGGLSTCRTVRLDGTKDSWRWQAVSLWNRLPVIIRCELSISKFKAKVKEWVRNNIPHSRPISEEASSS